jgi:E3 Ubiquitin ligase
MAFVLLIFAIGVPLLFVASYYSAEAKAKRALLAAKIWPIATFPENEVGRIVGQAQPTVAVLHAPMSGRPCVMFRVTVEEYRSSGKSGSWYTVITDVQYVPFQVTDSTGRALIDPTSAQLISTVDSKSTSGTFDPASPIEESILARHRVESKGWLFNKSLRYHEAAIEVGETIAILGSALREPDPDAPPSQQSGDVYRGAPVTRLRMTSSAKYPLIISDHPDATVSPKSQ